MRLSRGSLNWIHLALPMSDWIYMPQKLIEVTTARLLLAVAVACLFGAALLASDAAARGFLTAMLVIFAALSFVLPGSVIVFVGSVTFSAIAQDLGWPNAVAGFVLVALVWRWISTTDRVFAVVIATAHAVLALDLGFPSWAAAPAAVFLFLLFARYQLVRALAGTDYIAPADIPLSEAGQALVAALRHAGYEFVGSFSRDGGRPQRVDVLEVPELPWVATVTGRFVMLNTRFSGGFEIVTSSRAGALGNDRTLTQHIGSDAPEDLADAHRALLAVCQEAGLAVELPERSRLLAELIAGTRKVQEWLLANSWKATAQWLSAPLLERRIDPARPRRRFRRWLQQAGANLETSTDA